MPTLFIIPRALKLDDYTVANASESIAMTQPFASSTDTQLKRCSFTELADGVFAYTAEGDPNTGIVIGDESVLVFDAQATPILAQDVLTNIRKYTSLPVRYLVLSHYHAVRVLGAAAYPDAEIISSLTTKGLIKERGLQDWESELRRFPRLFAGADSIPGLTWPTMTFEQSLHINLGNRQVQLLHPGAGHTAGDTVLWLEEEQILFSGDLVESEAAPYCGDAYLSQWPSTLSVLAQLNPNILVPGRGDALLNPLTSQQAISGTLGFVSRLYRYAQEAVAEQASLEEAFYHIKLKMDPDYQDWVIYQHCLPFSVSRAYDEASGMEQPAIWTAERDQYLWNSIHHPQ